LVRLRCIAIVIFIAVSSLACNAPFMAGSATITPTLNTSMSVPDTSEPPIIVIEAPGDGAQAVIGEPFNVRIHATDSKGITRVEMRESGRIVISQSSPEPNPDFSALLKYQPTNTGQVTLQVVAFRQSIASNPVNLTIDIVGSKSDLKNPASLDPTMGVAAGAICTIRVNVSGLNLRTGPGVSYKVLGKLKLGEELIVIGRSGTTWYQAKRNNNTVGWAASSYVEAVGDCMKAPETTPSP
jgi:hypothetical protein